METGVSIAPSPLRAQSKGQFRTRRPLRRSKAWRAFCFCSLVVLLVSSVLVTSGSGGEERAEPIRIGALTESWGPTPSVVGLRDGLLKLGYRENKDFVIGVRFTQGDLAALPAAARDLVHHMVDLIFVTDPTSAEAARMSTSRIPIVFAGVGDPMRLGLIESFARPSGNITGVTDSRFDLGPKRLELFLEIIPDLKRILFAYDANNPYSVAEARMYRDIARRLGIVLVERTVRTESEAEATLAKVRKGEVDGILAPGYHSLNIPGFILEASSEQAIPTMFHGAFWVERGGLASYGPEIYESGRQAARLVDKILKGARPAEIPVEVNSKIEFAINLKAVKALGLSIAPEVLYQADRLVR